MHKQENAICSITKPLKMPQLPKPEGQFNRKHSVKTA